MKVSAALWCLQVYLAVFILDTTNSSATYRCGVSPNEVIIVVVNDANYANTYIADYKDDPNCQPKFIGSQSNWTHATFTLAENSCGMTSSGGRDLWTVLATENSRIEQHTDVEFATTPGCDFTGDETVFVEITSVRVQNITFSQSAANLVAETVTMVMNRNSDGAEITSCYLGENVTLSMTLGKSKTAKGIKVFGCYAKPTKSSNETFALLGDNGCPEDNRFISDPFHAYRGYFTSGGFRCFKFPESTTLYFTCAIGFCSTDDDSRCISGPSRCSIDGRNKRWVTGEGQKSPKTPRVDVINSPYQPETENHYPINLEVSVITLPEENPFSNNKEKMEVPKAMKSTIFTVTTIALACLFLAAVATVIIVPLRMLKLRRQLKNSTQLHPDASFNTPVHIPVTILRP
ncbi:uncharacterized protein LOC106165968 [Lingula anatina]|uniref:Uncharacterized protein LOC106165968 n=1 Tax=Lingula anatina TaxID=7574 RepID=A0A1S3IP11_LINAN|nr:uncharacterized protein LOC106165968 [Lingula anatina]|eukprot:XP_013399813.1 uncharacterized protein LOC106165968 [Lingula anatina]